MGDYWVHFAKTGNPNGKGLPVWKPVKGKPTDHLVLSAVTASVRSPTSRNASRPPHWPLSSSFGRRSLKP